MVFLCRDISNWFSHANTSQQLLQNPLPKISEIRQMLQLQHRFHEAQSLVKSESLLDGLEGVDELLPFQDFFETLAKFSPESGNDYVLLGKTILTRIFFAEEYTFTSQMEKAREQLTLAEKDFRHFAKEAESSTESFPRIVLLKDRAAAKLEVDPDPWRATDRDVIFAERAKKLMDMPVRRVHLQAAMKRCIRMIDQGNAQDRSAFTERSQQLLQQYFSFEDDEVKTAYFCVTAVTQYGTLPKRSSSELLERIIGFESTFPEFDLPRYTWMLSNHGRHAASEVGDETRTSRYHKQMQMNEAQCPWKQTNGTDFNLDNITDSLFHVRWNSGAGHQIKNRDTAMQFLLEWVKHDFRKNLLDGERAQQLLQWPRLEHGAALTRGAYLR